MNRNDMVMPNLYHLQKLSINEINGTPQPEGARRFVYQGECLSDFANIIIIDKNYCPHLKITRADFVDGRLKSFFGVKCIYYVVALLFLSGIVVGLHKTKTKRHVWVGALGFMLFAIMFMSQIWTDISPIYIPTKKYSVGGLKKLLDLPKRNDMSRCIIDGESEILIGKREDFGHEFACVSTAPGESIFVGAGLTYDTMKNLCGDGCVYEQIDESIFLCRTANIKSFYYNVFIWLAALFAGYFLLSMVYVCVMFRTIRKK